MGASAGNIEAGLTQKHHSVAYETGELTGETCEPGEGTYSKLRRFAGRYRIEQRGIERVADHERTDTNVAKVGTLVCKS